MSLLRWLVFTGLLPLVGACNASISGNSTKHVPDGTEIYKRIEARVAQEKSFILAYDQGWINRLETSPVEPIKDAPRTGAWGILAINGSTQFRLNYACHAGSHGIVEDVVLLDGDRLRLKTYLVVDNERGPSSRKNPLDDRLAPDQFSVNVRLAFVRAGIGAVGELVHQVLKSSIAPLPNVSEEILVTEVQRLPPDKDGPSLSFKLSVAREGYKEYKDFVILWYDPVTYLPKKRHSRAIEDEKTGKISDKVWEDLYDNWKLQVDEEIFKKM